MTSPHRIGQVAKAELEVTAALEAWGSPDADYRGRRITQLLLDLGWTPPHDPSSVPPLRGDTAPPDSPGRRAFNEARKQLAARPRRTDGTVPTSANRVSSAKIDTTPLEAPIGAHGTGDTP